MKSCTKWFATGLAVLMLLLVGCSSAPAPTYAQLAPYVSETAAMALPQKTIIALGEATHGNKEFTQLKQQVFQQLVEQQAFRAFSLEGDFGGCQKVNAYIAGGEGTAAQAVAEIGFQIYKTQEMADLVEWMRGFNEGRQPADQIRFYGYDMQRYDNNKEGLFGLLQAGAPELCARYQTLLAGFTDEAMYDLDAAVVKDTLTQLEALNAELEAQQAAIEAASSPQEYALAREYARCIEENTRLRTANNYGTLRDGYMAGHVAWILDYESQYYAGGSLFVAGHNSHIGKTAATAGTEKVMGELLGEQYGDAYYTIGTEFYHSDFLAPDTQSGERTRFTIQNSGDDRLAVLLHEAGMGSLFLDIDAAEADEALAAYLQAKQPMSAVGESFSAGYENNEKYYTQSISPAQTYNALIFIDSATPSTMLT